MFEKVCHQTLCRLLQAINSDINHHLALAFTASSIIQDVDISPHIFGHLLLYRVVVRIVRMMSMVGMVNQSWAVVTMVGYHDG